MSDAPQSATKSLAPVVALGGPTAAGKTALAVALAQRWGAEVVSADAMQVYRGMDIGTAKATAEERAGVPHHGLDLVAPTEPFDAADFVALVNTLRARPGGPPLILAGGTSLYLRAVQRGLVQTPKGTPAQREGWLALPDLHARLAEVDPVLAARLHPNDRVRLVRGIEVYELTGQPLSSLQDDHAQQPDTVDVVGLWLDRADLRPRIEGRVHAMVDQGYVEEVRGLLHAGVPRDARPMRSLGYRHMASHVLDALPLDEAIRCTQRDTWRFAKKQRTWWNTLRYPRVADLDEAIAVLRAAGLRLDRAD